MWSNIRMGHRNLREEGQGHPKIYLFNEGTLQLATRLISLSWTWVLYDTEARLHEEQTIMQRKNV